MSAAPNLSGLTEEEQAELLALSEVEYGYPRLADFICEHCPTEPPPPHLGPLISLIERARRGERVRACLHMPPRHSKTTTILRGLVWYLMSAQADTCAYATYSGEVGWEKSGIARNFALQVGLRLAADSKAKNLWKTPSGGGMYGTGVGGPLTGRGVDGLMIVDDPFSNPEEAMSPVIREKVWKWFNGVVYTRLQKRASVIVVHTRWHPDDLIGRLMKQAAE